MTSYYKEINGRKLDRALLDLADELTDGQGDGRLSKADARRLLTAVQDANEITATELETLEYIRDNYAFTDASAELFRGVLLGLRE